jgi:small subunit ribosomal protein S1
MSENEDFAALLSEFERAHPGPGRRLPQLGDRVKGRILSLGPERAFVDLGAKAEGSIDLAELTDDDGQLTVQVGDPIEAVVISRDEQSGTLVLGSGSGRRPHDGVALEEAYRGQLPVQGLVTGVTKGGVEVQIAGARGFCPASQIDIRFVEDLQELVGQHLTFRITRYEGGRRVNLVVSRRAILEEEQQVRAAETRARLAVGAVLEGTVTALKDYGAFVDLGGVEGMVHVSELALERVTHPQDVLKVGQSVEVSVLRIEKTGNPKHPDKIALSIRALAPDPWEDVEQRFAVGSRVQGRVTRLQPFGVFVELAPGVEGLVHISELGAARRVAHPHEVVNAGDRVEATVLGVDVERRRISLSLDDSHPVETQANAPAKPPPAAQKDLGSFGEVLLESMKRQEKGRLK